jgi:predicted DNA-binding transcriptional regulator AlpA
VQQKESSAKAISSSQAPPPVADAFIPFKALRWYGIPFSRVYLNRLIREGRFCAPYQLSKNRLGFKFSDVMAWLASRPLHRPGNSAGAKLCAAPFED